MIIYCVKNKINGKRYVGQHNESNPKYMGSGLLLKRSIKKYGIENFEKIILVKGNFNKALTDELEKHFIQLFATIRCGYNICKGGNGGDTMTNNPRLDEIKQGLSHRNIGSGNPMFGKKQSIESIDKNRQSNSKKPLIVIDTATNGIKIFSNSKDAAFFLECQSSIIRSFKNKKSLVKRRFKIEDYYPFSYTLFNIADLTNIVT